jgi:hypothetical protein
VLGHHPIPAAAGGIDAVARVGAHQDRLPQDVVARLAVRAQAQRVGQLLPRVGAEECRLFRCCWWAVGVC